MAETSELEASNRYGTVALLDVLGTKNRRKIQSANDIISSYTGLAEEIERTVDRETKGIQNGIGGSLKELLFDLTTFSDTFIITGSIPYSSDSLRSAHSIVQITGVIIGGIVFHAMEKDIPLRGAVAVGEFHVSKKARRYMILGDPVDEAVEFHNLSQWVGVSAAPSAYNVLAEADRERNAYSRNWGRYDIPLKDSIEKNGWAIKWPAYYPLGYEETVAKTSQARKIVWKNLLESKSIDVVFKWRNTVDFFDYCVDSRFQNESVQ